MKNLIEKYTNIKIRYSKDRNLISGDIIVNNNIMFDKIATNGPLGVAESYMDGDWDSEDLEYTIAELLSKGEILADGIKHQSVNFLIMELKAFIKSKMSNNTLSKSKNNISYHYDIGHDLYNKMLGDPMIYSCAYFYKNNMTLEEAQYAKIELIAKKLDLKKGMKILDIGCGYGTTGYYLAKKYEVQVVGLTLSKDQKEYVDKNYKHKNLEILLQDYREHKGQYDRIYSVGMFEHVGRKNYHEYFDKCYELLKDDGIMLIHTIGTNVRKWNHNSFINKYIFPEGELPHISNLTDKFVDRWNLENLHNFGISYEKTLRKWYENLDTWKGLEKYDTRFRRMWNFYLLGCAASFQIRRQCLWQIVYTKLNSNRPNDCHHIHN